MAKTVINVKVDKDTKEKAQVLAGELGLPLSTIINANLREFVRNGRVVFSLEPSLKPQVVKELRAASMDYAISKNISKGFSSIEDLSEHLGI